MKKIIAGLILAIIAVFSFGGCGLIIMSQPPLPHPNEYYGEREVGDFIGYFSSNGTCSISGTTEQGNAKRFLVIPKQIEDSPVTVFGKQAILSTTTPKIESEVLEKVFIESSAMQFFDFTADLNCSNFEKIICIKECSYRNNIGEIKLYYPRYVQKNTDNSLLNIANVSYYYNYENAENHGYYWIDDCDYGKTIEFIPDDPIREGYEFGGWYKEPECINKWDFETDTLPPTKTQLVDSTTNDEPIYQETVIVYQETRLYAQWVEKN